jgi:hypothetical protein
MAGIILPDDGFQGSRKPRAFVMLVLCFPGIISGSKGVINRSDSPIFELIPARSILMK